jgi:HK97 family phage portal protein
MGFLDAIAERLGYQKAMPSRGPGMLSSTSGGTGIQIDTLPRFKTGSASQYLNRYGDQAWVFACIRVIQSKGAGVPLKVYKKNGDNLDEQPNHPLKTLLDYVNPFMNGYDLMEATHGYLELTGNAYWLLDAFVNGKPTEIYPLNPQMVKIRASKSKFIDGYVYNPTGNPSDQVLLAADEIIHFKNWHPSDPYYGLSPLAAAREAADSMLFADRYNKSFFANSAEPGGVLQSDEIIVDEATRTRILSAWNQSHSGVRKAHRIALLEGGLKFIKTASSHNDMQFVELKKMSREDILAVYGVPPIMVGVFDEANYSNAREQRRIFWVDSMVPRLSKIESVLNEWLAIPWGGDIVLAHDLSGIEALKQDEKLSAEVDEIRSRSGLMTINEIREGMKMPPVPWGDTWNAPLGLSPIDGRDSPQELQEPPQEPPPAPPAPPPPPGPPGNQNRRRFFHLLPSLQTASKRARKRSAMPRPIPTQGRAFRGSPASLRRPPTRQGIRSKTLTRQRPKGTRFGPYSRLRPNPRKKSGPRFSRGYSRTRKPNVCGTSKTVSGRAGRSSSGWMAKRISRMPWTSSCSTGGRRERFSAKKGKNCSRFRSNQRPKPKWNFTTSAFSM